MKYELKSIGIWSFTRVFFFINLAFGAMIGIVTAMFMGMFMTIMSQAGPIFGNVDAEAMPVGVMIVFLPIFYGLGAAVFNTLMGIVLLAVYNLMVRLVGGLELDLHPVTTMVAQPVGQGAQPIQQAATQSPPPPPAPAPTQPMPQPPSEVPRYDPPKPAPEAPLPQTPSSPDESKDANESNHRYRRPDENNDPLGPKG